MSALRSPLVLWGTAWALAALALVLIARKRLFPGDLIDADAMDYAQIARHIAQGHGFSTSILRPLALSGWVSPQNGMTPDVSRAPLYPFVLFLGFVLRGGHGGGNVVVGLSLALFLASVWAVYLLARDLFPGEGQPWAALLSAGLYLLGGTGLGYAAAGLPVPLTALVVTLFLRALLRAHETGGRPVPGTQVVLVGVLLGLCYLAQFSLLLLVVPTLVYVFATRAPARAWAGVGLCLLGFVLVTLPWLIRTAVVTHGSPFFTLLQYGVMADTSEYPGASSIYRSVAPGESPFSFFFSHFGEVLPKVGRGLAFYQAHLPEAFSVFVLGPALASLLWRAGDARVGALRGFVAFSLFALALASSVFAPSMQTLAPFAPAVSALAVGFVFQLMARQGWAPLSQRIALWAWAVVVGFGLVGALAGRGAATLNPVQNGISMLVKPPLPPPLAAPVAQEVAAGSVLTDTPWEVTWRTGLPAVWLPRDNQAYEAVAGLTGKAPARSLLLTPNLGAYGADGEAPAWLLLAAHPQAWAERAQALQSADRLPLALQVRAAQFRRLIAVHRIPLTAAQLDQQVAQAQASMPALVKKQKDAVDQQFGDNYGPISQVVQDFQTDPRFLQQPEANRLASTLFLRRDFLRTLTARARSAP